MSSDMFSESDINVDLAVRVKCSIRRVFAALLVLVWEFYVPVRVCVNQAAIVIPVRGVKGCRCPPSPQDCVLDLS